MQQVELVVATCIISVVVTYLF